MKAQALGTAPQAAEGESEREAGSGDALRRCSFGLITEGVSLNEEKRTARFVASTNDVDSYGEVVEQYWDLKRFRANPVVLFSHNRGGAGFWGDGLNTQAEMLPVGKGTFVDVVGQRLEIEVQVATEKASPLAEYVWQGLVQGTLRTVSVGFMPGERVREERHEDEVVYHIGSAKNPNELFEVSIVVIPANPAAVMLSAGTRDAQAAADPPAVAQQIELPGIVAGEALPPPAAKGVRMDPEKLIQELNDKLAARSAELATATGRADTAETELLAERSAHIDTKAELDAAKAAIAKAEAERQASEEASILIEVEALSGKKFLPSEIDDEIEIRTRRGHEYWQARMDARADLGMCTQVVPDDKTAKNTVGKARKAASALLSGAHKAASEVGN